MSSGPSFFRSGGAESITPCKASTRCVLDPTWQCSQAQLAVDDGMGGVATEAILAVAGLELPPHGVFQRARLQPLIPGRSVQTLNRRIVADQTLVKPPFA